MTRTRFARLGAGSAGILTAAFSLAQPALGFTPTVQVGLKTSYLTVTDVVVLDSAFLDLDVWNESYVGLSGEVLISPVKNLSLRLELAELRFFTDRSLGGGQEICILTDLDADVIWVLPIGRGISPLVYAGMSFDGYCNKPVRDWRAAFDDFEYRVGPGLRYRATRALDVFLDFQILTWQQKSRHAWFFDAAESRGWFLLGVSRVNLGVRYDFGAR